MAHDIFLTYSRKDQITADAACAALERHGIGVWMAPRDIVPGADWPASIIGAINGARAMVLIFSSRANNSTQVKREVERAVSKGLPIIPFRIEDVPPSPTLEYLISSDHWLDAFAPGPEAHLERLGTAARQLIDGMRARPAPVEEPRFPAAESAPSPVPAVGTARLSAETRATPPAWLWMAGAAAIVAVVVLVAWWLLSMPSSETAASNGTNPTAAAGAGAATLADASPFDAQFKDIRAQNLPGYNAEATPPGARAITIAVLGTGVSPAMSKALGSRLKASSVVPGEPDPEDLHGLGTSVIALVAALAPSAKIHAIKVFSAGGTGLIRLMGDGIRKAAEDRADVILADGGSPASSPENAGAVQAALAAGALVIAPAGNDGKAEVVFPAAYPGALAVGAIGPDGSRAEFSNYGRNVLFAPGVKISTLDETGKVVQISGTSLSAAVASAMAGVVWASKPRLSAPELRDLLTATAVDLGAIDQRNPQSIRIRRLDVAAAAREGDQPRPAAQEACERECRRDFSNCNISTVNDTTSTARDACQAQLRACQAGCAPR